MVDFQNCFIKLRIWLNLGEKSLKSETNILFAHFSTVFDIGAPKVSLFFKKKLQSP